MAELGVPNEIRHQSSLLWCLGSQSMATERRVRAYLNTKGSADRPSDYALQARACARHDALERLPTLRTPTLVVGGNEDRLTPGPHAEALAKAIPGAELAFIPGAGHLPYLECPDAFARMVLDYLGSEAKE
jgi:pimeloyl-ACP methyl ester carboxylesterase